MPKFVKAAGWEINLDAVAAIGPVHNYQQANADGSITTRRRQVIRFIGGRPDGLIELFDDQIEEFAAARAALVANTY